MSRIVIDKDIGRVSFGPHELPGEFQRLTIDIALEVDKKKVPGRSGLSKQPLGFNDADVSLQLKLVPGDDGSDPYEQLASLRLLFYGTDGKARPQSYPVINRTCRAMGIKLVLFEQIRVLDENTTDVLTVELKFSSYEPAVRRKEKRSKANLAKVAQAANPEAVKVAQDAVAALQKTAADVQTVNKAKTSLDAARAAAPPVIKVSDGSGSVNGFLSPADLEYVERTRRPPGSPEAKALKALQDFNPP